MNRPGEPLIEFDCKLTGGVLLSGVFYASDEKNPSDAKQIAGREALSTFISYLAENGFIKPLSGDEFQVKGQAN